MVRKEPKACCSPRASHCATVWSMGRRKEKAGREESSSWNQRRRVEGSGTRLGSLRSFLPAFSLPYTHYSLVARSEALRRRFMERRSWENTAPPMAAEDWPVRCRLDGQLLVFVQIYQSCQ